MVIDDITITFPVYIRILIELSSWKRNGLVDAEVLGFEKISALIQNWKKAKRQNLSYL